MDKRIQELFDIAYESYLLDKEVFECRKFYIAEYKEQLLALSEIEENTALYKKRIDYCASKKACHEKIYKSDIDALVDSEVLECQTLTDALRDEIALLSDFKKMNKEKKSRVKTINKTFKRIMMVCSPEIYDDYLKSMPVFKLWVSALAFFNLNCLEEISKTEGRVFKYLSKRKRGHKVDIDKKIDYFKNKIQLSKENTENIPYYSAFIDSTNRKKLHEDLDKKIKDEKKELNDLIYQYSKYNIETKVDA